MSLRNTLWFWAPLLSIEPAFQMYSQWSSMIQHDPAWSSMNCANRFVCSGWVREPNWIRCWGVWEIDLSRVINKFCIIISLWRQGHISYQGTLKEDFTVDLLFDWFGISYITTENFCFYLQNRLIQTGQTGGQLYSDTAPFSIPCSYQHFPPLGWRKEPTRVKHLSSTKI
jgi:hypothetical protein